MLEIDIPEQELWDEENEIFIRVPKASLKLEHSLLSLKNWEAKWHKAFLKDDKKTLEEIRDYIRCMTINKVPDDFVYDFIPVTIIKDIIDYIKDPHTATWFSDRSLESLKGHRKEVITAEVIYYWMVELNIPIECQKWHLNQLITLIKVINLKNVPKKKMSPKEAAMERAALNAKRRAQYKTKG